MTALPPDDSTAESLCLAEFLRDWSTFTAAFLVDLGAPVAESSRLRTQLVLEILDPDSKDALRVTFTPDQAVVETVLSGQTAPLRDASLAEDDEFRNVAMSLTPNRVLVRVNGRLLLNVPRPAELTGNRCRFRISTPPASTISELRFDGE